MGDAQATREHNERDGRFCCAKGGRSHTKRYMQNNGEKKEKEKAKTAGALLSRGPSIEADPRRAFVQWSSS
jgi:hypothetical protein